MAGSTDSPSSVSRGLKRWLILHPFLFGVFPIVYLYAQNLEAQVKLRDALGPLAVVLGAVTLLFAVGGLIVRDPRKSGLIVSAWTLLFFSYGYVWGAEGSEGVSGSRVEDALPLLVWVSLAAGAVVLAVLAGRLLAPLTKWLNVASVMLVVANVIPIVTYRPGQVPEPGNAWVNAGERGSPQGRAPDIYYLVFDRYARQDTLTEVFGFDNGPFLTDLATRGFFVATESLSNYPQTSHSLAASMNMRFLDFLTGKANDGSLGPVYDLIVRNDVVDFLKSKGYRFVVVSSGWAPTNGGPMADRVFRYKGGSEFSTALFDTTLLEGVGENLGGISRRFDRRTVQWHRVLYQFDRLAQSGELRGPKFVLAHFLLPHAPYVFDRQGRFVSEEEEARGNWKELYVEQLQFTNAMINEVLDRLLSGPKASPPIIILQADEGPHPKDLQDEKKDFRWEDADDRELRLKLRILNAYYLPAQGKGEPYPSISPVNSFRLVLSAYFGVRLPLLPDHSYIFRDNEHLYDFIDVTGRVRGKRVSLGMTASRSSVP